MDDSGEIKVKEENQFAVGDVESEEVRSFQINFGQIYVGKVHVITTASHLAAPRSCPACRDSVERVA